MSLLDSGLSHVVYGIWYIMYCNRYNWVQHILEKGRIYAGGCQCRNSLKWDIRTDRPFFYLTVYGDY